MTGYLITIEGIDGSGKSTVWDSLTSDDFDDLVPDVTFTREPTASKSGELLREILSKDNSDVFSELFLFMADHSTHVEETVRPALDRDELVICDRYIDSRCAYQGHTISEHMDDALEFVYDLHQPWSQMPDCTILLDLDPKTSVERTSTGEKYEVEDQLAAIRENYHQIREMDTDRYVTVDASQSPSAVREEVRSVIREQLHSDSS